MTTSRILLSTFGASAVFLLTAYSSPDSRATLSAQTAPKVANPSTGEGLPNPAPKVTKNWGELPAGRKWGTSAGLDIDPVTPDEVMGLLKQFSAFSPAILEKAKDAMGR